VVLSAFGIIVLKTKKRREYRNSLERDAARRKFWLGVSCLAAGVLFGINDFPFRELICDQYHGDRGVQPYQNLIDYVNARNGLVFWAHPEARNVSSADRVFVVTEPYAQDLVNTRDYSGFCVWYDGYSLTGKPEGLWDRMLNEYLQKKRTRPVWAIAGLAFDYYGNLDKLCNDLRVVALAPSNTQSDVLDALRQGKVYVMRGNASGKFILDRFSAGTRNNPGMLMGETLSVTDGCPLITIQGHFQENAASAAISARLLRNGKIIKTFEVKNTLEIQYEDEDYSGGKVYYRLEIESPGLQVITNPIFVETAGAVKENS